MILRNGSVALPGLEEPRKVDVRVEGGKIVQVGTALSTGSDEVVDAEGLIVLPGGIDPHVHFDDPGYTDREDFFHGSCAAATGGVTTVIDMPCTSIPPVCEVGNLKEKLRVVERKAVVDFGLFGGVCGQSFAKGDVAAQMQGIADFVLGFKTYFISGMESFARLNHYQFTAVLLKAKELGLPVLLHAEDYDYVQAATEREMREGDGPLNYYRSRPETAEILAVGAAVQLASETGADLHIVHIGSARAGELIGAPNVSGETAPHYLAFELEDFARMGSVLKCTPPVKGPGNREGLWRLLAEGRIDFVASDHAPCRREEKHTGSIWTDYAGMPGCGVLLPYMFSEGFVKGRLTLRRLLEITSENAARRYGIFNRKGSIEPGKDGDFALINPKESWTVRGGEFSSKGKVTPFEGIRLRGKVSMTILRGETIYTQEKGVVGEAGAGRLVRRSDQAG